MARWRLVRGVAPLVTLAACGDIWGFQDLTPPPDAQFILPDATTSSDAAQPAPEASGTPEASDVDDGPAPSDDAPGDDAALTSDAADATWDALSDATTIGVDETSVPVEAAPPEASPPSDGAADAIAACQAICAGCCDTTGHCQNGDTATVCGNGGGLCEDCPACGFAVTPCCKAVTSGGGSCGCAVVLTGSLTCN
jgi:hypothetical protein